MIEIKKVKKEVEYLEVQCPKCKKILRARTKEQMDYNMNLHLDAHKREEESKT